MRFTGLSSCVALLIWRSELGRMKFLLINQYYLPDTAPTGRYLHDLAKALLLRGHEVCVLCSRRAYNGDAVYSAEETIEGVRVQRVRATGFGRKSGLGKIFDYASFYGALALKLFNRSLQFDIVLALTTPPHVGLLARWGAHRRGVAHAHWIMDIYPDVLAAHGKVSESSFPFRQLAKLTRRELRGSPLIVTLGEDMVGRIRRRVADLPEVCRAVESLPLWSEPELRPWTEATPPPFRIEQRWGERDVVLMYSGNMGRGHRFGEFLAAAEALNGDASLRWVFVGGGKRRGEIEDALARDSRLNVLLLPYAPAGRLREHLCSADVHLVSLDAKWQGCMVPSKVQGIFAVGKPIIFVGGSENSIAQWIADSGGGWVVPENDLPALLRAIEASRDPEERRRRGAAARAFAEKAFSRELNLNRLCEWLELRCSAD